MKKNTVATTVATVATTVATVATTVADIREWETICLLSPNVCGMDFGCRVPAGTYSTFDWSPSGDYERPHGIEINVVQSVSYDGPGISISSGSIFENVFTADREHGPAEICEQYSQWLYSDFEINGLTPANFDNDMTPKLAWYYLTKIVDCLHYDNMTGKYLIFQENVALIERNGLLPTISDRNGRIVINLVCDCGHPEHCHGHVIRAALFQLLGESPRSSSLFPDQNLIVKQTYIGEHEGYMQQYAMLSDMSSSDRYIAEQCAFDGESVRKIDMRREHTPSALCADRVGKRVGLSFADAKRYLNALRTIDVPISMYPEMDAILAERGLDYILTLANELGDSEYPEWAIGKGVPPNSDGIDSLNSVMDRTGLSFADAKRYMNALRIIGVPTSIYQYMDGILAGRGLDYIMGLVMLKQNLNNLRENGVQIIQVPSQIDKIIAERGLDYILNNIKQLDGIQGNAASGNSDSIVFIPNAITDFGHIMSDAICTLPRFTDDDIDSEHDDECQFGSGFEISSIDLDPDMEPVQFLDRNGDVWEDPRPYRADVTHMSRFGADVDPLPLRTYKRSIRAMWSRQPHAREWRDIISSIQTMKLAECFRFKSALKNGDFSKFNKMQINRIWSYLRAQITRLERVKFRWYQAVQKYPDYYLKPHELSFYNNIMRCKSAKQAGFFMRQTYDDMRFRPNVITFFRDKIAEIRDRLSRR